MCPQSLKLPYVIDNQTHRLLDVLQGLLVEHSGRSLDVATAYFTVGGFGLLRDGLQELGSFRLLLGGEPRSGEELGLRAGAERLERLIERDLEGLPFSEETLCQVEDLIAFLRREAVQVRLYDRGFLHAKAWIFYADRPGGALQFDRFRPVLAVVGSSNFTAPGLTSNRELNLAHRVVLDPSEADDEAAREAVRWLVKDPPDSTVTGAETQLLKSEVGARAILDLEEWFEARWTESRDFKEELIELLDASKFGQREYTPYQVYLKALYEYFRGELGGELPEATRTAVELTEFQEDAVRKARAILARYSGVFVADSVGLGKTWIGKRLLEEFAYHRREKALVVAPASLRQMWERELQEASIAGVVLSQEELGRQELDPEPYMDADVVLVDESHNFRNPVTQRYQNLERILQGLGGRGRQGARKKIILLTATPVSNDLMDLYHQLALITGNDRGYFAAAGIGDLYRFVLKARRENGREAVAALFNLLEEVVIRRTRLFIREAYPEATLKGEPIHFPERRLRTVRYDLEAAYEGIYDQVVSAVEALKLAPYNLEAYKKSDAEVDEMEAGREQALVGIFKSLYLKRFESSVHAFRISVDRALQFLKTFESYILDGRILRAGDFRKALSYLRTEESDGDGVPSSLAARMDETEEVQELLGELEEIDPSEYDLRRLHEAVQHDVERLSAIRAPIAALRPEADVKLQRLKELLASEDLRGKKILVFSYFRDTARYLYRHLGHPDSPEAQELSRALGGVKMRLMDSGADASERTRIVQAFAPRSNDKPEWEGTEKEIDILISTDVLSEGQNLQDCGQLINYDLHWNPTRMVQRAGRIDRIGTAFDTLWIYNIFPDAGLEKLLGLVQRLTDRIETIDRMGLLDASVLGEVVHPRNFNTLRRIAAEDGRVLEEEEEVVELASGEFLQQELRRFLEAHGEEEMERLPDGIHSGMIRAGTRGIFFYFQAPSEEGPPRHFWRFCDVETGEIEDNRYRIAQLLACTPETPRVVDPDVHDQVFELQERAIQNILESATEQRAVEEAPRSVDPLQRVVATALQALVHRPDLPRERVVQTLRFLGAPLRRVTLQELRRAYKSYQTDADAPALLDSLENIQATTAPVQSSHEGNEAMSAIHDLRREDLRLICFEVFSSR